MNFRFPCTDDIKLFLTLWFMLYCTENPTYVFPEMKLRGLITNSYFHIFERFVYIFPASFAAAKSVDGSWEYINCSQIHDCGKWETVH